MEAITYTVVVYLTARVYVNISRMGESPIFDSDISKNYPCH